MDLAKLKKEDLKALAVEVGLDALAMLIPQRVMALAEELDVLPLANPSLTTLQARVDAVNAGRDKKDQVRISDAARQAVEAEPSADELRMLLAPVVANRFPANVPVPAHVLRMMSPSDLRARAIYHGVPESVAAMMTSQELIDKFIPAPQPVPPAVPAPPAWKPDRPILHLVELEKVYFTDGAHVFDVDETGRGTFILRVMGPMPKGKKLAKVDTGAGGKSKQEKKGTAPAAEGAPA